MAGRRVWVWGAAAGLLLVVPLSFLLGLLTGENRLKGVTTEPSPVVVAVSVEDFTDDRAVQVALTWEEGVALLAPPWSGMVTRVAVAPGEELSTGDPVVTVDGVVRLAGAMPEPFFRRLEPGDRGNDVEALHDLLMRLGYLHQAPGSPSTYGSSTAAAVRDLAARIGAAPTAVFDPGWIVRIPTEPFLVDEADVAVGAMAPGTGTPIARGAPQLVQARLQSPEGGALDLDPGVAHELMVRETSVGVMPGSVDVAIDDLPLVAKSVPSFAEMASGRLRRAVPLEAMAVPTAAVMSSEDGDLCVWLPDGPEFASVPVRAIDAQGGMTRLLVPNPVPADVLVNPAEVLEDAACPLS